MVLWEITLGTAYFLGLKRTYKLALKIQRRLVSPKRPKIRQFLHRKTRSIFDAALKVHREIQQRDIEVGKNLGNWILRWLDKMKPTAQIRVGKPTLSNNNADKTMKKQLTDPVDPKSPRGYGNQESSRRLFTTSTNTWPVKPVGNSTQYRLFMSGPNNTFELKNTIFGFDGVVRKDIMQWMGRN